MISQETEELTDESSMAQNGAVTAASNLPEQPGQAGDKQQSQRAETRQRANYEVGSVTRQVDRRPGSVRRQSVAVLVNGVPTEGANGETTIVARTEPELQAIRELVAAAVGFDEARGDELTVKSMPFVATAPNGTEVGRETGLLDRLALDSLAWLALVGLFALIALGLTLRALRKGGTATGAPAQLDNSLPRAVPGLPELQIAPPMAVADIPMLSMAAADFDFDNPGGSFGGGDDPVARLKQLMKERQDETVRLLNGWIGDDERSTT